MKQKYLWAVTMLSLLLFSMFPVQGSNISLSSSIGEHVFDDMNTSLFISDGSFTIHNQDDVGVLINVSVDPVLFATDLNVTTGLPRTHSVNDEVIRHPVSTGDWIMLNETNFSIAPDEYKTVHYRVCIPVVDLPSFVNESNGFLCYIMIDGGSVNVPGANVGVNYRHKVFLTFTGDLPMDNPVAPVFPLWMWAVILGVIMVSSLFLFWFYKKILHRNNSVEQVIVER